MAGRLAGKKGVYMMNLVWRVMAALREIHAASRDRRLFNLIQDDRAARRACR